MALLSLDNKTNDIDGNPIEIAAVVVWKVIEARISHLAYAPEVPGQLLFAFSSHNILRPR